MNICFVYRRSVAEHYILVTFEFAIQILNCADGVFSQSFYTHEREAECHIRNVTIHVDCKHQMRVGV